MKQHTQPRPHTPLWGPDALGTLTTPGLLGALGTLGMLAISGCSVGSLHEGEAAEASSRSPLGNTRATHCVAENGDDRDSGAYPRDCWRTAQRAADRVAPGDVVCFLAGTYPGMTLKRSGTPEKPIVWRRCDGVKSGRVLLDASHEERGAIMGGRDVTDQVISGLDFSPALYGSGSGGLYHWGGNHRWEITDMHFRGQKRAGATLWKDAGARGRNRDTNRDKLWRLAGDDIWFHDNSARYWTFQILGESGIVRRLLVEHNDLAYSGSHVIAVDRECRGRMIKTGNVYRRNYLGQSYTSDTWQINQDGGKPCKGGYRIIENILYASGENAVDMKGLDASVIEGNIMVGFTGDSGGPSNGNNFGCGGAIITGSGATSRHILVRNNVIADNANGIGSVDNSGAYNNTLLHNMRSAIGINTERCGSAAWSSSTTTHTYFRNNYVANSHAGPHLRQAPNVHIDGNLYAPETEWTWHPGRIPGQRTRAYVATDLGDWQSKLDEVLRVAGGDANASASGAADRVFRERGMNDYTLGHPFTDIELTDVLRDTRDFRLRDEFQSGGQPVAQVRASSRGTVIQVGELASAFCCGWDMPANAPAKDEIRVAGTTRRITDVDYDKGTITVDRSVKADKGAPIDIVYPSGRTSRQRGAHEFWTGERR